MNVTLRRFGHPAASIREFEHWVVLIRPVQTTPYSAVIAARSEVTSLANLLPQEAAELPRVVAGFEAAVRQLAPAIKFNYLALMMIDPNPHFHAIPRYACEFDLDGAPYRDAAFPRPPELSLFMPEEVELLRSRREALAASWPDA